MASVLPQGTMPVKVNEIAVQSWAEAPGTSAGWESQAVMLVPMEKLNNVINNKNDQPIIEALTHA